MQIGRLVEWTRIHSKVCFLIDAGCSGFGRYLTLNLRALDICINIGMLDGYAA